jgi:hypothetical protein
VPSLLSVAPVIGAIAVAVIISAAAIQPAPGAAPAAATAAPTAEETFVNECGACHLAFPAGFLPKRSWQAIMDGLSTHFGEDASLDAATAKVIADYLLADASDAIDNNSPALRGLRPEDVPMRITDTPYWKGVHGEVSSAAFARPNIKSPANCLACHGAGGNGGEN